jgi:putative flippase GtrA
MSVRLADSLKALYARHHVVRFVVIGGVNTGFSYGTYALALLMGLGFKGASLCSIVLGILFSFATQGLLVFGGATRAAFIRFVAVWACIYATHISIIGFLEYLGINNYLGGLLSIPFIAALSYLLQRRFVFRVAAPGQDQPLAERQS